MGVVRVSILFVHAWTAGVRGFMPMRARMQVRRAGVHRGPTPVQPGRAPVDAGAWGGIVH